MCVTSLSPVAQVFEVSSKNAVESLVGVMKPRIRAIVTDAVGGDQVGAAGFTSVMGGTKAADRHMVRMNYDLDEEAYHLLEVSEGYISRLYVRFIILEEYVHLVLLCVVSSSRQVHLSRRLDSSALLPLGTSSFR